MRLQGQFDLAISNYSVALATFVHISDSRGKSTCNIGMADIALAKNDLDQSKQLLTSVLKQCSANDDTLNMSRCLRRLAIVEWRQGNFAASVSLYLKSISLAYKIHNLQGMANALYELGQIQFRIGDPVGGETSLNQAHQLFHEIGLETWSQKTQDCLMNLKQQKQLEFSEAVLEV